MARRRLRKFTAQFKADALGLRASAAASLGARRARGSGCWRVTWGTHLPGRPLAAARTGVEIRALVVMSRRARTAPPRQERQSLLPKRNPMGPPHLQGHGARGGGGIGLEDARDRGACRGLRSRARSDRRRLFFLQGHGATREGGLGLCGLVGVVEIGRPPGPGRRHGGAERARPTERGAPRSLARLGVASSARRHGRRFARG